MVCPVCESEHVLVADWCPVCGAYLGLLKRQPRHVSRCVCASIVLGMGLFAALAWQVFGPLLHGSWPAGPGNSFWWGFGLGAFFLGFGLTARRHLAGALHRRGQDG